MLRNVTVIVSWEEQNHLCPHHECKLCLQQSYIVYLDRKSIYHTTNLKIFVHISLRIIISWFKLLV